MKLYAKVFILLFSSLFFSSALASEDITGVWQGKLEPAPGTELVIQFKISKGDDGSYSVVLDSPDQGAIKNINASSVVFDSGKLTLDVSELSGAYEGNLKDGKFEGNWKQEGTLIPLNLAPWEKPVLTEEDIAKLVGHWNGPLEIPSGSLTFVLRLEKDEGTGLKGFLDSPDEGAFDIPIGDVELVDDDLRVKIPAIRADIKGKFKGNQITGEYTIRGNRFHLTLNKGEYKPPVIVLDLPEDSRKQLSGEWHGTLKMPNNVIHVSFKFENTEKDGFVGYYEVPDRRQKIPISEASIKDGTLSLKIRVGSAEYKGKLHGDSLEGEWAQAGNSNIPLSLKKGEYVPPVYNLEFPDDIKQQLTGEWYGDIKLGEQTYTIVINFKTTEKGEFIGIQDNLTQNAMGMPVFEATYSDDRLTFKIPSVEFKGKLDGDKLIGEATLAGSNAPPSPATIKKGKYVPPVHNLDLPDKIKQQLSGEWHGNVKTENNVNHMVFRFETTKKGDFSGFHDNLDRNLKGVVIYEAALTDGKLTLKMTGARLEGELAGDELIGQFIPDNGNPMELTLKKGESENGDAVRSQD